MYQYANSERRSHRRRQLCTRLGLLAIALAVNYCFAQTQGSAALELELRSLNSVQSSVLPILLEVEIRNHSPSSPVELSSGEYTLYPARFFVAYDPETPIDFSCSDFNSLSLLTQSHILRELTKAANSGEQVRFKTFDNLQVEERIELCELLRGKAGGPRRVEFVNRADVRRIDMRTLPARESRVSRLLAGHNFITRHQVFDIAGTYRITAEFKLATTGSLKSNIVSVKIVEPSDSRAADAMLNLNYALRRGPEEG